MKNLNTLNLINTSYKIKYIDGICGGKRVLPQSIKYKGV
ncbi:hypothetical protein AC3_2964 [Clostridium perfringens E str. JGS1987]|uniref:Uncharacterized protein n=1 Tax=Clostridium perfringens E str. JGS1987 TaxID=451755 RepID=B1BQJ8_CLOPF|nr:hypothetical protein AC3_2964 [Clostridium perfringens E str. JGS1987]